MRKEFQINCFGNRVILAVFFAIILPTGPAGCGEMNSSVDSSLIDNGSYALSRDGRMLASHNINKVFVPASIMKLATALAALHILGEDYRFKTSFYLDQTTIFIKGFGDPFLISEEVEDIVTALRKNGLKRVERIVVDESAFQLESPAPGSSDSDNPYDAPNSALSVNFNTVDITVDDTGTVRSAEPQTPFLPIMDKMAPGNKAGTFRLNISTGADGSRGWRYVGQLFAALMRAQGIADQPEIGYGRAGDHLSPFYVHQSRSLTEMIGPLMRYSNNFIANQIFLAMGAHRFGFPATWEKSRKTVAEFFRQTYNLVDESLVIEEGSGLSRRNRMTAGAMVAVLDALKPYGLQLSDNDGARVKSGTLTGVYSYAGYVPAGEEMDSVVIILNQPENTRQQVLEELLRVSRENEKMR